MATNTKRVMTAAEAEERKKKRAEVLARGQEKAQQQAQQAKTMTTQQKQQKIAETTKKASTAYSASTYEKVKKENQAQQAAVKQATAGKDSPSQYKKAYEAQKFDGNYGQFKDKRQAYAYASQLQNDAQRDTFLTGYAKYNGVKNPDMDALRADANAAFGGGIYTSFKDKTQLFNDMLGSLYDVNGKAIDLSTASYAEVVQGIRSIADPDKRKEAAANLEKLTKYRGNRFSGQTYDKDLTTSYLGNPDFDEAKYKKEVSRFENAFYPQSGHEAENEATYRKLLEGIQKQGYSDSVNRQLKAKLDSMYKDATGKNVPKAEAPKVTAEAKDEGGNWWDGLVETVSGWFDKEEEKEEKPEPKAKTTPEGVTETGKLASSSVVDVAAPLSTVAPDAASPTGTVPDEKSEVQGPAYQPYAGAQTNWEDWEILAAYDKGMTLTPESKKRLEWLLGNKTIRDNILMPSKGAGLKYIDEQINAGGFFELSDEAQKERMALNDQKQTGELVRYAQVGKTIGKAADILHSGALPEDVTYVGELLLADVVATVDERIENGLLTVPKGMNPYEYAVNQDPALKAKVDQVSGMLADVNDAKAEAAKQEKLAEEQILNDAIQAVQTDTATDEQIAMVAAQPSMQDIDVNDDELRAQYMFQLNPMKSLWYQDDGAFWRGDSAAAREGRNARDLGRGYSEYKYDLMETAKDVIDEYTRVAISRGEDLETYLGRTGVELEDIMDIAYNRMVTEGVHEISNPETPALMDEAVEMTDPKYTTLQALGQGSQHGLVTYAEGFMNAPYQIIDLATYEARRDELRNEYSGKYGDSAPAVYRKQLTDYAMSGKLDKESSEALLQNIRNARSIFDVAFDIDPNWLAGTWRDTVESLGKVADELEANTQYMSETDRMLWNGASTVFNNGAAMVVSTVTGGVAGKLGAGAKTASAIGTTLGHGMTSWSGNYEEYSKEFSAPMAGFLATRNAAATVLMNMGGTASEMNLYSSNGAAFAGYAEALRKNGAFGLVTEMVKQTGKHAMEEGLEEVGEDLLITGLELTDGIAMDIDQGKMVTLSSMARHVTDAYLGLDIKEKASDLAKSYLAGAAFGALFSVGGVAVNAYKGASKIRLENNYSSLDMASKILRGEINPTEDVIHNFVEKLQTDLQDSKFAMMLDKVDKRIRDEKNMMIAALSGVGIEERNAALVESRKADDYDKKAETAQASVQKNQSQYLNHRLDALKGNIEAAMKLDTYAKAWAEAGTALQEATNAASKCRQQAAKHMSAWISRMQVSAGEITAQDLRDEAARIIAERNAKATQLATNTGMEIKEGADPAEVVEDLKFMGEYPPVKPADDYVPPYTDEDAPPEMEGYAEPEIEVAPVAEETENAAPTDAVNVAETAEASEVDAEAQALQEEREAIQTEPAIDLKGNMRAHGVANEPGQFAEAIESWDGQQTGLEFVVAKTGDTLKSIGMADADVVLRSDKLKLIKEKHPEMSDAVIAQLPEVIENPVVVMESATVKDRVVLMGTVTDDAGSPVAVVVSINPSTNLVAGTQFLRMNSAYGKDRSPQDWINKHKILYANKNRAAEWAMSTGLQLPVDSTPNSDSSTDMVAQSDTAVKGNIQADYVSMDNAQVQPTATTGKAKHNPIQTFNRLAKDLGIGKTFGTRKMNGLEGRAAGYYETNAQYVVSDTRHASSIEVDAHELGHAIAAKLNMTGTQQMVNNLTARFPANYPAAQLPGEAFAEFFWRYMVSDQEAQNFAGQSYVNMMERNLRRAGLLKSVKTAQREVRQFLNASTEEQFKLMTRDKSDMTNENTLGEKVMDAERQFISSMVDSTRAAEDVNAAVREQNDGQIDEAHNLRNSALMQGHATKRAATVLNDHLTDVHGTVVGASLKQRLADAGLRGQDFDTFISYMLAKHSIDRDRQNKLVVDRGAISIADTEAFIRDTERDHPEIAAAARAFQEFRHDFMMEYMVRTGFMTERTLSMFEAMYPNYVPTYRVKDRGRRGIGGQTYTVRQATGSTEQIINPMDSFVDMVNTIVAMNLRNETYKTFDRVYNDYDGMGIFGREVTQDRRPDVNFAATQDEVLDVLMQANADDDVIRQVLNIIGRPHNTNDVNLPNIIRVQMEDGSTKFYEIFDQALFDMFEGTPDSGASVSKLISHLTSFMTAMTTGSNPVFGIRNALRDYQNSVNYGSWAATYADGLGKWLNAAWDVFRDGWIGEHTGLNANNATYEQYKALGGGGWTRVETKTKKGMTAYRGDLIEGYNTSNVGRTVKWAGKQVWSAVTLARLNEIIEQTSRYAEYKHGKHDLSTVAGRREAFLAAQDVTTDFSRRGNSAMARELKALIPFFNASLQGIYRTGRQLTEGESDRARVRFMKTVINTGLASALASLVMLKYMDDEEKEEFFYLSDDLKAKHMYLPNFAPDILGESPLIRIPLNQDPLAYAIHAAVTNAVWSGEGEEWAIELGAVADNIMNSLNPVNSTVLDPLISISTNKNWYGSNIVPRSMDGMYATNQYSAETAQMFIEASHWLDATTGRAISPMMLQYIAEQYTGFVGQMVIPFFSKNEFTGEINGIDAVIEDARKTLVSDPLKSNDIVSTVYDSDTLLNQVVKAGKKEKPLDMLRGGLSQRDAQDAYDDAYEMTHKGGVIYEAKKEITACYEEIDGIEARKDLTDEQKYLLQSEVRRRMIEIALDANETMAEFREKYIDGESFLTRFMHGTVIRKESDDD